MRDHSVYVVHWTKCESIGSWILTSHWNREWRHESWGEPIEHKTYYLAPSEGIVLAHWSDWAKTVTTGSQPWFVKCEKLGDVHIILEMK
jgi:hypothetical protein